MQDEKMSAQKAVGWGQLIVNGSVVLIFLSVLILSFIVEAQLKLSGLIIIIGVFVAIIMGWIGWSFIVPRWRLWALERVEKKEIFNLHRLAVTAKLEWSYDNIFFLTEIKSKNQIRQEAKIILDSFSSFLRDTVNVNFQWSDLVAKEHWMNVIFEIEEIYNFVMRLKENVEYAETVPSALSEIDTIKSFIDRYKELDKVLVSKLKEVHGKSKWANMSDEMRKFLNVNSMLRADLFEHLSYCKQLLRSLK